MSIKINKTASRIWVDKNEALENCMNELGSGTQLSEEDVNKIRGLQINNKLTQTYHELFKRISYEIDSKHSTMITGLLHIRTTGFDNKTIIEYVNENYNDQNCISDIMAFKKDVWMKIFIIMYLLFGLGFYIGNAINNLHTLTDQGRASILRGLVFGIIAYPIALIYVIMDIIYNKTIGKK